MTRLKLMLPLLVFVLLALVFWSVLKRDHYDPQYLPSALIGQPLPAFSLMQLEDEARVLTLADLPQQAFLLNVWATWCISCRVEHPYLNRLAQQGVAVVGLNYKDDRLKALQWLDDLGNPYRLNLFDPQGRLGLDLGVYGAPETYLVDRHGVVRFKHVGVVDEQVWQEQLQPLYRELQPR